MSFPWISCLKSFSFWWTFSWVDCVCSLVTVICNAIEVRNIWFDIWSIKVYSRNDNITVVNYYISVVISRQPSTLTLYLTWYNNIFGQCTPAYVITNIDLNVTMLGISFGSRRCQLVCYKMYSLVKHDLLEGKLYKTEDWIELRWCLWYYRILFSVWI